MKVGFAQNTEHKSSLDKRTLEMAIVLLLIRHRTKSTIPNFYSEGLVTLDSNFINLKLDFNSYLLSLCYGHSAT